MDWKRLVRLPIWVIVLCLGTGVLSAVFAPGTFLTVVWTALVVAAAVGTYTQFKSEVNRLKAKYIGQGPVDKAALRSDIMQSLPVPLWLAALLAAAPLWTVVAVMKLIGFVIGLVLVLLLVALVVGGVYLGYKVAKKRNLF